jgi:hypothetical protein
LPIPEEDVIDLTHQVVLPREEGVVVGTEVRRPSGTNGVFGTDEIFGETDPTAEEEIEEEASAAAFVAGKSNADHQFTYRVFEHKCRACIRGRAQRSPRKRGKL